MRRAIVALLRLALRGFYRRIEVVGLEKVPPEPTPAIFVLNHPNGLIDPLFILCLAPRRVAFLAKSTIFKMPVLGMLARALDALPVYRQQDAGEDRTKPPSTDLSNGSSATKLSEQSRAHNAETFAKARDLLARGGTMAVFPEGKSHSEPGLQPIKTGAARIALSARAGLERLDVVPAGLYYTEKQTFRSRALVLYGEPLPVEPVPPGADGEPPRDAVQALSKRIEDALRAVTLNADAREALETVVRAERIFSSDDDEATRRTLARELELRRRFETGYSLLRARDPDALARLDERIRRYESELAAAGIDPATLRARYPIASVIRYAVTRLLLILLVLPLAAAGALLHWPAYRLVAYLARRFGKTDDDILATIKIMGAMLLFPATWLSAALAAGLARGFPAALAALALAPALGWLALRWTEVLGATAAAARAFFAFVARPRFVAMLLDERRAIRDEILAVAAALEREPTPAASGAPSASSAPR